MFQKFIMWIFSLFGIQTQTTQKEVEDNSKYAFEYERVDSINIGNIFSNKLANYVINDSNINIVGDNKRVELLDRTMQSMWKKAKKIVSMAFGIGGVVIVPYVKGDKIFYNLVSQNRLTIDEIEGEDIIGATIIADKKVINKGVGNSKTYYRLTNYKVKDGYITITQKFTDENGKRIDTPEFWKNIEEVKVISGVDKVLFGFIKSPINNRKADDKYGVPITYGCEDTIKEIKETMRQILDEYRAKKTFVGVDVTLFDGRNGLPKDGIYKGFDFGKDGENKFEIFDPEFRSYLDRLTELYRRLEHEMGTSAGIMSEVNTQNATATEIRRSMYDTFTIVDDMRTNVEKGLEDFIYSANVLANAYGLTPMGDYEVSFDWDYSLLEDSQEAFTQLVTALNKGIVSNVEVRQWLKPDETLEDSEKAIAEIKESEPSVEELIGVKAEEE